jgi:hypothetical protein
MGLPDRIRYWNVTADKRVADHPADAHVPVDGTHFVRAIDADPRPATPHGLGHLWQALLGAGDLGMMRRQLRN